jgi:uncharacterized protein YlbG (UPF0298 family)
MAKRKGKNSHYEAAFEKILRDSGIPYIAINEFKRPIISGKPIKNFDFIVFSKKCKYIIDIKGKSFFRKIKRKFVSSKWKNWILEDDWKGLKQWQKTFGKNFKSIIVYPYWLKNKEDIKQFHDIYYFKNKRYGIVGIYSTDFLKNRKRRSKKWNTFYIPKEKFKKFVKPIKYFIPEIKLNKRI